MKCVEFQEIARDYLRQEWLNEESRREAARHLSACGDCQLYLDSQATLTAQMKALAVDLEQHQASAAVEAVLGKAFAARHKRSAWPKWAAGAIAASLLATGAYMGYQTRQQTPQSEAIAEFLPLRSGAVLNPGEAGDVVRIRVPRAELVRFGYPYNPEAAAGQTVQADVLLGEDGVARAIRFVQ